MDTEASSTAEAVILTTAIPVLPVADVQRAVAFYRNALGFTARHVAEDYGIMWRDTVEVHFWVADGPEGSGAEPDLAGTGGCRIAVTDLAEIVAEFGERGALTNPDGTEYALRDPDGNVLTFYPEAS